MEQPLVQILDVVLDILLNVTKRFTGNGFVVKSICNKSVVPKALAKAVLIGLIFRQRRKGIWLTFQNELEDSGCETRALETGCVCTARVIFFR